MNVLWSAVHTLLLVIGLLVIHKQKETEEDYFILKLIGYYLLGSFRFSLNNFPIPLGFLIFLFFFRPTVNANAKRNAALLGLIFFIISVFSPVVAEHLYERTRTVTVTENNLYEMNFSKDYRKISTELNIPEEARVSMFDVEYEPEGTVKHLTFEIIANKKEGLVRFYISFQPSNQTYTISPSKLEQWNGNHAVAQKFFSMLDQTDMKAFKGQHNSDWFALSLEGYGNQSYSERYKSYLLTSTGIELLEADDFPMNLFFLRSIGMNQINETRAEGESLAWYYFDPSVY